MSYVALYRKFRPNDFSEVRGQESTVTALKNQLKLNRLGHAYLFTGTRGTGKTTIAKIMAKAVNCEHPTENGPCNECAMCKEIQAQNSMNVMEIDAASNNSVDNVRELIESVKYSPAQGNYKVYIIDEAHMLSEAAFNALLKTLEEPPSYVIFILATTEVHKIPITILSRCQKYDFHRITIDTIADQLRYLCDEEKIDAEDAALRYIAKAADGSMRDGVSLLDRCVANCIGEKLTYDKTLEALGAIDNSIFYNMLVAISEGNIRTVIGIIEVVVNEGRELTWFVNEFVWYLRNLLIISSMPAGEQMQGMEEMMNMSAENLELLKKQAKEVENETIIRYIRILSELSGKLKKSGQKRVLTEVAFIKLCKPEMETDIISLKERIRNLEMSLEHIRTMPVASADEGTGAAASVQAEIVPERVVLPAALGEDVRKAAKNWDEILENMSPANKAVLKSNFKLSVSEGDNSALLLVTTSETFYSVVENCMEDITGVINEYIGKDVKVTLKLISDKTEESGAYPDIAKLVKKGVVVEFD